MLGFVISTVAVLWCLLAPVYLVVWWISRRKITKEIQWGWTITMFTLTIAMVGLAAYVWQWAWGRLATEIALGADPDWFPWKVMWAVSLVVWLPAMDFQKSLLSNGEEPGWQLAKFERITGWVVSFGRVEFYDGPPTQKVLPWYFRHFVGGYYAPHIELPKKGGGRRVKFRPVIRAYRDSDLRTFEADARRVVLELETKARAALLVGCSGDDVKQALLRHVAEVTEVTVEIGEVTVYPEPSVSTVSG